MLNIFRYTSPNTKGKAGITFIPNNLVLNFPLEGPDLETFVRLLPHDAVSARNEDFLRIFLKTINLIFGKINYHSFFLVFFFLFFV